MGVDKNAKLKFFVNQLLCDKTIKYQKKDSNKTYYSLFTWSVLNKLTYFKLIVVKTKYHALLFFYSFFLLSDNNIFLQPFSSKV